MVFYEELSGQLECCEGFPLWIVKRYSTWQEVDGCKGFPGRSWTGF